MSDINPIIVTAEGESFEITDRVDVFQHHEGLDLMFCVTEQMHRFIKFVMGKNCEISIKIPGNNSVIKDLWIVKDVEVPLSSDTEMLLNLVSGKTLDPIYQWEKMIDEDRNSPPDNTEYVEVWDGVAWIELPVDKD